MIVEKLIWTTLPAGYDEEGRLRLSVHVAPRLAVDDGDPADRQLGEYETFAAWPDRLGGLEWEVQFTDHPGGQVESLHGRPTADADLALWERILGHKTLVRPHAFTDHAKRDLHVFPVRDVLQVIEHAYAVLAAAGPDLPSVSDSTGPLAVFGALDGLTDGFADSPSFWREIERAQQRSQDGEREDGRVVHESFANPSLPWDQQAAQEAMTEASRFYYRPGSRRPDLPKEYVEPPPDPPRFDFHEILSLLADHPAILRRLGIIVDLVVDVGEPAGNLPHDGVVRVVPHGELPKDSAAPWTRYDLDKEWFGARPSSAISVERGLVNLTREFWDLFQVDVDGAALQAVGFGGTLGAMLDPKLTGPDTPTETGAPALRSAGLALARNGRGDALHEDLVQRRNLNTQIEAGQADWVEFSAEDLVRGYRVDVWDGEAPGGPRWQSLHARVSTHHVDGLDEPIRVEDEGFLKATSASSERADHPTPSDDLYLHETVAAWEGWSLAAPRPGKRIVEPGEGDDGTSVARHDPAADQALPIRSEASVAPDSLPRLRLGHTYRLRMRTVDLVGNSRPFSAKDYHVAHDELTTLEQTYLRFEPVPSPAVLRRHLDTEGESLEHLVIRSDQGITAAAYAASDEVTAALASSGVEHTYAADSQRHLAAPKGSAQMAEQDSRFEPAFGGTPAAMNDALRLALREEGTFLDTGIVDTATGVKSIPQTTIVPHPAGATLPAQPEDRGTGLTGGDPALAGAYAFYPDEAVKLPYLPDPLAIGVRLVGFDYAGAELFSVPAPFNGAWPDLAPFRLRLSEGPIGAAFTDGVLEVTLPQAEVVNARLSSVFPDDRLEHFAIWQWIPVPQRSAELATAAVEGRHWMLTPFRRVRFTHAVQRPLTIPDMSKVISTRSLGQTFATFRGPILNHAKSTGRLDVFGTWTEDVDLLTDDEPRMAASGTAVPHSAHGFGFDLAPDEDAAQVYRAAAGRTAQHEFGDTKHRRIAYHSVATTRFRELLPVPIAGDPSLIQRVEEADAGGTPKPLLVHDIPSSARPAAPDPLYVLPTFRWERNDEGPERVHVRHGNAVRVWLRRPWFSSGDGEQLGVVLKPGIRLPDRFRRPAGVLELEASRFVARRSAVVSRRPLRPVAAADVVRGAELVDAARVRTERVSADLVRGKAADYRAELTFPGFGFPPLPPPPTAEEIDHMLQQYVTQWGMDPVWASQLPKLPPIVSDFPRHVSYAAGLTLQELPDAARVVVAGHDVFYDTDRKLWFSDIEIEPGNTYYPFVRLALARFQPHSVNNAHLSRVVMTDFIQVAPDRRAEVARTRGGYAVTVRGYAGRNAVSNPFEFHLPQLPASTAPNTEMRVSIEQRSKGVPGDLGWERVGSEVVLSPSASGWYVTWSGSVSPGPAPEGADQRILITEVETHRRDLQPGDPTYSTSPRDFVRERVVYADAFDL